MPNMRIQEDPATILHVS